MAVVFGRVIAIFSLVLLGFIVNRKKILPDESRKYLINSGSHRSGGVFRGCYRIQYNYRKASEI